MLPCFTSDPPDVEEGREKKLPYCFRFERPPSLEWKCSTAHHLTAHAAAEWRIADNADLSLMRHLDEGGSALLLYFKDGVFTSTSTNAAHFGSLIVNCALLF